MWPERLSGDRDYFLKYVQSKCVHMNLQWSEETSKQTSLVGRELKLYTIMTRTGAGFGRLQFLDLSLASYWFCVHASVGRRVSTCCCCVLLGIKLRALHMLGKCLAPSSVPDLQVFSSTI